MNNSELDSVLKKARVPERANDFWETFPRRVTSRLHRERVPAARAEPSFLMRWAWTVATAAGIAIAIAAAHWNGGKNPADVLASVKLINETLAMFPHHVRAIVQDENGLRLVLSEQEDVPASPPLYVRICEGGHCSSVVTFSGQEIQIAGRKLTVLADARGGIILEGSQLLWSSTEPLYADSHLKIEAKNLGSAAM